MQNPAFWARVGLLWCLFIFAACWCASTKADSMNFSGRGAGLSLAVVATTATHETTVISVTNSHASTLDAVGSTGVAVHAIPTLDGFGLFVLMALLGLAALWFWHRRE